MVQLFTACASQWRHAGFSGLPVGLDYAGVRAAAAMMGLEVTPKLFAGLRIMEAEAAAVLVGRWGKK